MISIIVIAVTGVGLTFIIILFFMKLTKSKDTANSILVSKQFGKMTLKFADAIKLMRVSTDYQDTKVDYILDKIERGLRDITITAYHNKKDMQEFLDKSLPDKDDKITKPEKEDNEKSLSENLLKMVNSSDNEDKPAKTSEKITKSMSMFEKIKEKSLSQLGIKDKGKTITTDDLYDEFNKKTTSELYDIHEKMYKEISKYNDDENFRTKYELVIKIIKERTDSK